MDVKQHSFLPTTLKKPKPCKICKKPIDRDIAVVGFNSGVYRCVNHGCGYTRVHTDCLRDPDNSRLAVCRIAKSKGKDLVKKQNKATSNSGGTIGSLQRGNSSANQMTFIPVMKKLEPMREFQIRAESSFTLLLGLKATEDYLNIRLEKAKKAMEKQKEYSRQQNELLQEKWTALNNMIAVRQNQELDYEKRLSLVEMAIGKVTACAELIESVAIPQLTHDYEKIVTESPFSIESTREGPSKDQSQIVSLLSAKVLHRTLQDLCSALRLLDLLPMKATEPVAGDVIFLLEDLESLLICESHRYLAKKMDFETLIDRLRTFLGSLDNLSDSIATEGAFFGLNGSLTETGEKVLEQCEIDVHEIAPRGSEPMLYTLPLSNEHLANKIESMARGHNASDGISIAEILEVLCNSNIKNLTEVSNAFLRSYRYFSTPEYLLQEMISMYSSASKYDDMQLEQRYEQQKRVRLGVLVFVKYWVANHYKEDFRCSTRMLELLHSFLDCVAMKTGNEAVAQQLKTILNKKGSEPSIATTVAPVPVTEFSLLSFTPLEFAEQLTYVEFQQYQSFEASEFFHQRWAKDHLKHLAPHVGNNAKHFNRVGRWIVKQVLDYTDAKKRADVVVHCIKAALHLLRLNNFNGLFELLAGVNNSAVLRLRKTWAEVPTDFVDVNRTLVGVMRGVNYERYRKLLKLAKPPLIPYIGMFLTDLTFLDDGNPNLLENGNVNFYKFLRMNEFVDRLLQYQTVPYKITPQSSIVSFLEQLIHIRVPTEDESFAKSNALEPIEDIRHLPKLHPFSNDDTLQAVNSIRALRFHSVCAGLSASSEKEDREKVGAQELPTDSLAPFFGTGSNMSGKDDQKHATHAALQQIATRMMHPTMGVAVMAKDRDELKSDISNTSFSGEEIMAWLMDKGMAEDWKMAETTVRGLLGKNLLDFSSTPEEESERSRAFSQAVSGSVGEASEQRGRSSTLLSGRQNITGSRFKFSNAHSRKMGYGSFNMLSMLKRADSSADGSLAIVQRSDSRPVAAEKKSAITPPPTLSAANSPLAVASRAPPPTVSSIATMKASSPTPQRKQEESITECGTPTPTTPATSTIHHSDSPATVPRARPMPPPPISLLPTTPPMATSSPGSSSTVVTNLQGVAREVGEGGGGGGGRGGGGRVRGGRGRGGGGSGMPRPQARRGIPDVRPKPPPNLSSHSLAARGVKKPPAAGPSPKASPKIGMSSCVLSASSPPPSASHPLIIPAPLESLAASEAIVPPPIASDCSPTLLASAAVPPPISTTIEEVSHAFIPPPPLGGEIGGEGSSSVALPPPLASPALSTGVGMPSSPALAVRLPPPPGKVMPPPKPPALRPTGTQ